VKNSGVPIVAEGVPFVLIAAGAAIAFWVGGLWTISLFFWLATLYILYFFRNPERLPPVGSAMVASPADGKVIFAGEAVEAEFTKQKMRKVSIFMNLFDVHVNRVPVDGTIRNMKYRKGRFMAASEDRASEENEHNALLFETQSGQPLVMVQVAGLVARRIICYPTIGAFILKGQRMGLIRFGSRVDLYMPLSCEVLVKVGEKVLGGETIVARLAEGGAT
jgi:phosphatidylserine decarboxylase